MFFLLTAEMQEGRRATALRLLFSATRPFACEVSNILEILIGRLVATVWFVSFVQFVRFFASLQLELELRIATRADTVLIMFGLDYYNNVAPQWVVWTTACFGQV